MIGGQDDTVLALADKLARLFKVNQVATSYGASIEIMPLEQLRSSMEPWYELQRI